MRAPGTDGVREARRSADCAQGWGRTAHAAVHAHHLLAQVFLPALELLLEHLRGGLGRLRGRWQGAAKEKVHHFVALVLELAV